MLREFHLQECLHLKFPQPFLEQFPEKEEMFSVQNLSAPSFLPSRSVAGILATARRGQNSRNIGFLVFSLLRVSVPLW